MIMRIRMIMKMQIFDNDNEKDKDNENNNVNVNDYEWMMSESVLLDSCWLLILDISRLPLGTFNQS